MLRILAAMTFSVAEHVSTGGRSFSFEFFPPKTDVGERNLWHAINALEELSPTFVSVTYGAGGSTRDRTIRLTGRIAQETDLLPVGHLTCVGSTREELAEIIDAYADAGVHHILALRGDPPGGLDAEWESHPGGLEHADELVTLIDSRGDFTVGVAAFPEGHPEASSLDDDAKVLRAKQEAGADFAITQFFFDPRDYFRLVERASAMGVDLPIIPGIMPVTNVSQIERFAALSGAAFPPALAERFHALGDAPEAVVDLGVEVAAEMCQELLDQGAPGLHFYTLNRSNSTLQVFRELGLDSR